MQSNVSKTMFYSLLFAIGGAPTIAMLILRLQQINLNQHFDVLIGLTCILAAIIAPLILLQNVFLMWKRKQVNLEDKIEPICHFYFVLDIACLVAWIIYSIM